MEQANSQKIAVLISLNSFDINLITCGIQLANVFQKELCLLYLAGQSDQKSQKELELDKYRKQLETDFPSLIVSTLISLQHGKKLASEIADDQEAILLVAGSSQFKTLAKSLRTSPVPYLFINEKEKFVSHFSRILYPVDLRPQNKDAMLWTVFFGRNNRSEIIAIGASDKSKISQKDVAAHLGSLKKTLTKLNISHKIYKGARSSLGIHNEAFETAGSLNCDLLVLLGSSSITWLDMLIGLPEQKIIEKTQNLPVLVVNPRREMYLVCD